MTEVAVQFSELQIEPLTGTGLPETVRRLLPKSGAMIHEKISFRIRGPLAVANAMRRTIELEVPVQRLVVTAFTSDDGPHIVEMITRRISSIPIRRNASKTVFTIDVHNEKHTTMSVTTSHIRGAEGIVNPGIEIVTLSPRCRLQISMRIESHIGYVKSFGQYAYSSSCVAVPYAPTSSLISGFNESGPAIGTGDTRGLTGGPADSTLQDPDDYLIKFITNGDIGARELIVLACDTLLDRLQSARILPPVQHETHGGYIVRIPGECYTLAGLITQAMFVSSDNLLSVYPNVIKSYQTRGHDQMSEDLEIVWSCRSSPQKTWTEALDLAIEWIGEIKLAVA